MIGARGRRGRARLARGLSYVQFVLAGVAVCGLVWWPLLAADQAQAAGPTGSGAGQLPARSAGAAAGASAGGRAHVGTGVSPWVRIARDAPVGLPVGARAAAADASASDLGHKLTVTVVLKRTNQAGFNKYLQEVYDRHSPQYHRYLTQAELAARFGPSVSEFDAVRAWLFTNGFRVTQSPANRLSISAQGTEGQAQRAFDTPIATFKAGRKPVYGNTETPAVPRAMAGYVQAVMGLSDRAEPVAPVSKSQFTLFSACLAGVAGNAIYSLANNIPRTLIYFATGPFLISLIAFLLSFEIQALVTELACIGFALGASAAGVSFGAADTGGGPGLGALPTASRRRLRASSVRATSATAVAQKIGLLEFDGYHTSDVSNWLSLIGADPSTISRLHDVSVNGGVSTPGPGESEVLLDIDSLFMSADAGSPSYVVYEAPPSTSFVQMFQAMIGDGDTVISNSWSECEDQTPLADAQAINSVLASAAASGVTVVDGSGDDGSTCLDGSPDTVGVPADSPNATAVGGTSPTFGPGLNVISQAYWDDESSSPPGGAGGFGVSKYFRSLSYQQAASGSQMRSLPDLSFFAAPEAGMQLCQADDGGCPDNLLWGGTSMAAPLVAGEVAELNAHLGRDIGNLNQVVYPLAGTDVFESPQSLGSNFAHVGLGAVDFTALLQHLEGVSTGPVSASASVAAGIGQPQADGSQRGVVRVDLTDANGFPIGGKTVTITPNAGSSAVVSPASVTTDSTDGAAVFTVTDTTPETVTFTVKDTTDNVTLTAQPTLTFVTPTATGASIQATPSTVTNDGTSQATISVYLENGLGRPASGKTVSLTENGGSATISPESGQAVTDSNGVATFTATDTAEQTVSFTATDVSDGSLPVPGTATVTFEPSGSSSPCKDTLPSATSPFSVSSWGSGLAYNAQAIDVDGIDLFACSGANQPAFDSSGNLYVPDTISGEIDVFGPSGGTGTPLPDTDFTAPELGGVTFGKDGELYASLPVTHNTFSDPEIVQLDPTTGAVLRVLATQADGVNDAPFDMATDPLSGDLFVTDSANFGDTDELERISDPSSASPTVSAYTTALPYSGGDASSGIAFAPDGTIYVAMGGSGKIVSVSGTNVPGTPTVTTVASVSGDPFGVAVASASASGQATALDVTTSGGDVYKIDLTTDPASVTTLASGGGGLTESVVGPDGCLYGIDQDQILRLSSQSGCAGSSSSTPEIALQESSGSSSPTTGSSVGLTASLENVSGASGTPVHFTISGPNLGVKLADANGGGQASVSYAGVFQGVDTITASATVNGTTITSAPVQVHWTAGKDTTFVDLSASQQGGQVGKLATVTASLWDETQTPVTPVGGQSVTLGLGGAKCSATTNGSGVASCRLTPKTVGLLSVTASYAGDSEYTAASATNTFDSVTDSPAIDVSLPKISGKAKVKDRLTCSPGSWSNGPYGYDYQWNRDGTPIHGGTSSTYKVVALDEGSTLTCTVIALNTVGKSDPATSRGVRVPVPRVKGCPAASGKISGIAVGRLRLGMTRKQARRVYTKSSTRGFTYKDFFCLTPEGVRVGYGSPALLKSLPRKLRGKYSGRVVWVSTSNPVYAIRGVRAGAALAAARKRLHVGKAIKIGLNYWYLAPAGASTAVLKVRHGLVQEIGIATKALTRTRKAQRTLMSSFD